MTADRARRHLVPAALAILLVAPVLLGAEPAEAQSPTVLRWDYTVRVDDPTTGMVDVTLRFSNLEGIVERVGLLTESHDWPLTDVRSSESRIEPMEGGVQVLIESDVESVTFTVDVRRVASKGETYNAYLGGEWGLFKAEALALGFNYTFVQGKPFEWQSRVHFVLPPGWNVEMPYARAGDAAFTLPPGIVLPRGFVAMGGFETVTHEGAGKTFRYARLGERLAHEADMFPFLEKATGYYARVYGNATGPTILVASAPAPMFRGGLGGADSLFVHDESDLRVLSHEYAHAWQTFGTVTTPPDSAMWVNEGDADYHSALALFVTDYWSLSEVNALLEKWHEEGRKAPAHNARLTEAAYGSELEDFAYHKGALVLHALDREMRDQTGGEKSLSDVLRVLNAAHDQRVTGGDADAKQRRVSPVTNTEVLETVNRVTGVDFTEWFEAFVYGPQYPALRPVVTEENLALTNITVTPERPLEGENVTVTVLVENRGLSEAEKRIPLILDGENVGARDVRVGVGAHAIATFTFPAPGPGTHQLRALYLEKWFDVVEPARFVIERVATVPRAPAAGEEVALIAYVLNAGDLPGEITVTFRVDRFQNAGSETVRVDGNATRAVSVPWTFSASGGHTVEALGEADGVIVPPARAEVEVQAADRDGDGIPDVEDPYPENAHLEGKTLLNDVRNVVPAPGAFALLALVAIAALARRDRRGRE